MARVCGILDVSGETYSMSEPLNTRVEDCFLQAESFFKRPFKRPTISLKLRGQKAGVAHLHENLLRFNPQLYRENSEDFLRQTVPHEVAHLIAHQLFGDRIQPHGEEWQLIMRGVYELPPKAQCDALHLPLPLCQQRLPVLGPTSSTGQPGAAVPVPPVSTDTGVQR